MMSMNKGHANLKRKGSSFGTFLKLRIVVI